MWSKIILLIIVILAVLFLAIFIYGSKSWQANTKEMHDNIEAARLSIRVKIYDSKEIRDLPLPVQKYFSAVLKDGQPIISAVDLEHIGTFNMSQTGEQWKSFTSTQRVTTNRPGFDWEARVSMMLGIKAKVHDAYINGEGILQVSVLGFERLVDIRGTSEMAQGELMRYFAEAVWYPTALLPSQGVRWEAVDETSARATLKDGGTNISLLFNFDKSGLIETVQAESRMRMVGDTMIATPWECRLGNYELRGEILVPQEGEVVWILPEGPLPYWRGRITKLNYYFTK